MRSKNVLSIISKNKIQRDEKLKLISLEEENKQKEIELENSKKAHELQIQERSLKTKQINYLEEQEKELLTKIKQLKSPFVVSVSADEYTGGLRYIELKNEVEKTRAKLIEARANIVSSWNILLSKISASIFFIFILIRLSAENQELIESFTFLSLFQNLLGEKGLFLDFFFQDLPLISALSFLIAIGCKDYINFSKIETRTKLYLVLCVSVLGLFVSSLLFFILGEKDV